MKILPAAIETDCTLTLARDYTARVKVETDDSGETPWSYADGHGPVTDWVRRDKRAGELLLSKDRGSKRFYDFAAAVKLARKDGWNTAPYDTVETKGQRARRVAMADYEYLRAWCNDEWYYIGVIVMVYRNGVEIGTDALWGIESCGDYWKEVAAENINALIEENIKARRQAALQARRETRECNVWACRGMVTV